LWLFVNCQIENPSFDSQTKETLTTKPVNFGSTCTLSDKFLKEVLASGIIESIVSVAKAKEEAKLAKTLGPGKKKSKLLGIPKLEDAN
jgi:DNA topoisomerase II